MMTMSIMSIALAEANYSITVNGTEKETYTAYKLFDLSVDDPENPSAYRYTVNSAFDGFKTDPLFMAVFSIDAQGYVTSTETSTTTWNGSSALSIVADAAAKYAADHGKPAAGSVRIGEGDTSGTIALTTGGYYVVSSTLGSRAMLDTTPSNPAVTINEKNEGDTIVKEVKEDSTGLYGETNDAQVGDTVEFKSVTTIAARSINVKIHDKMDDGLTLNTSSIKVYSNYVGEGNEGNVEYTAATIKTGTEAEGEDTFTIVIPDTFAATATANQTLTVIYTAEINKNAITSTPEIDPQINDTHVTYGDNTSSTHDTTTTTTHKFEVLKYKTGDSTKANLADAVFQVKKAGTVVNLIKIDATNYRVADDTETGTASSHANDGELNTVAAGSLVSDFVTVASGNIVIWGVDADNDYTLNEVQPPKGYNKLSAEESVTVNADNSTVAEIENGTGTELPSTGGIGTTIFYVAGIVLVLGAAVVLISRRKAEAED